MSKPKITFFEASNEVPANFKNTLLSVKGENCTACGLVSLTVRSGGKLSGVVKHATVTASTTGTFGWSGSIFPKLGDNAEASVIVTDLASHTDSEIVETQVVAPGSFIS